MSAVRASRAAGAAGTVVAAVALVGLAVAYVGFYVYAPVQGTVQIIALAGMLVFALVVMALLMVFVEWWSGA